VYLEGDEVGVKMDIGRYSFEEYLEAAKSFHGCAAPGVAMGGFMVDLAVRHLPAGTLFDAVSETRSCLPDAIQLLTPCTVGNGWLKILNLGRYALSLYDKYSGDGFRVFVDSQKVRAWPEVTAWFFKLKKKDEQDPELLLDQIRQAGREIYGMQPILIQPQFLQKHHKGSIGVCALCGEPYPVNDGSTCRGCQGEAPYLPAVPRQIERFLGRPEIQAAPLRDAPGKTATQNCPFGG
jgi:formylmethanofuran dehydrogenase subunit E